MCIREGDMARVGCPDPSCVKTKRQATEEEVARVVSSDELRRWSWLREKAIIEKGFVGSDAELILITECLTLDPLVLICPMPYCQKPVPPTGAAHIDDAEFSSWDKLRICGSCGYSFCSLCKRIW
jgi:E3 ubiquitin-protein ligase RNF14